MKSLSLDDNWDIFLDRKSKNIMLIDTHRRIAQDVANVLRAFKNDMFFDKEKGIDHLNLDLSKNPQFALIKQVFEAEAKKVDDVYSAECHFISKSNRQLELEICLELDSGENIVLNL